MTPSQGTDDNLFQFDSIFIKNRLKWNRLWWILLTGCHGFETPCFSVNSSNSHCLLKERARRQVRANPLCCTKGTWGWWTLCALSAETVSDVKKLDQWVSDHFFFKTFLTFLWGFLPFPNMFIDLIWVNFSWLWRSWGAGWFIRVSQKWEN